MYHGTYPSSLPAILHYGSYRSYGAGCLTLREVHSIPAPGDYIPDRAIAAFSHPDVGGGAGEGPHGGARR